MAKLKTMDGNAAASYVSYAFTDVAAIYPITPSSNMAENVDEWVSQGKKNIFDQSVRIIEMQSEAGAAGAVHGSLQAGALTTTYTASQGLLLMIPNMYKIAGELLPGVFHVSARAVAAHALSIFGDHQDVMATRQTGCALLAESSVQEVMDLSGVAHLSAIKGRVPFINFFDGFRTSHELQSVEVLEYDDLAKLIDQDALNEFRRRALNPDHPVTRGTAQNPDIYFQGKEAANKFYLNLPQIVEDYMQEINKLTGKDYHLFNYHGALDAEKIVIAMGSVCETINEVVDYLNDKGDKVGALTVHLYRPFSIEHFLKYIPETVNKIAVLDRTKEAGSLGEPLYLDVVNAFARSLKKDLPLIIGGRYGLGSKDTTPDQIKAVFDELESANPKKTFTIGIEDDVTNLSLKTESLELDLPSMKECKFWGLGSDGTVGANKTAIKIIGDHTDMYAQAYFAYDSKKSGGVTISHLRFGKNPVKKPYLIHNADFIACHNQSYVYQYDILHGLKKNGSFVLNTSWKKEELDEKLPNKIKKYLAKNDIDFYIIDAVDIAQRIGLGGRINMIMQSAFFKISDVMPFEEAIKYLKEGVIASYGKKGQNIIDMNYVAIDEGINSLIKVEVNPEWADLDDDKKEEKEIPEFISKVLIPMNEQEGDKLPVSTFAGREDGTFEAGTSAYEKRGIAVNVPKWICSNCIQCNQCSYVCPHAVIRPSLINEEEVKNAPEGFECKDAIGSKGNKFRINVSVLDCTGCGNCAQVCPSPKKALVMEPIEKHYEEQKNFEYSLSLSKKPNPMKVTTVKGSQFETPLLEFSGACAGCGETPYTKLVTQVFGDRMMIANATGCSSIWGASAPSIPYTKNAQGHGPAWANSLFEDNAEYGLGMFLGTTQVRNRLKDIAISLLEEDISSELKALLRDFIDNFSNGENTRDRANKLIAGLEKEKAGNPKLEDIYENRDYLVKRSQWMFGGDGWAYDIGYGGLDHVIAAGEDVNILVLDTEVYSNTGGQSSKSTPTAAIAKFAAQGKRIKKKNLGLMAMSYGYVYVAQVAMGADQAQTLKAIIEAESHKGPSVVIAYAPCIAHGIKNGMGCTQLEAKNAVACGYWSLFRYNPDLKKEGKNPFILDSKEPKESFRDFLMGEVRYAALAKEFPEESEILFQKTEEDARQNLEMYKKFAANSIL